MVARFITVYPLFHHVCLGLYLVANTLAEPENRIHDQARAVYKPTLKHDKHT